MNQSDCITVTEYPGGILAIDSGFMRDRMATCYLVEDTGEAAFIETGTNSSVPRLLSVLERRGWKHSDVRFVIVTHVHLDHAGGAGSLMQVLPDATFLVHPRGARHMIDPARLEASVRMVYGDETYDATYGSLVPIAAERTRQMQDGESVTLGQRQLVFMDSPGHARHHFCVWDDRTRGWFTGDTFGLSYRDLDTPNGPFIFPTTTPVQFDPDALRSSIRKLMDKQPQWMYLTHFGRVGDTHRLADRLLDGVDELVGIAEKHKHSDDRTQAIQSEMTTWLKDSARVHGVEIEDGALEEVIMPDVVINTQGIEFWLDNS